MTASAPEFRSTLNAIPASAGGKARSAAGGVRSLLRIEGAAVFAAALALYAHGGFSWPMFALLFFAPDLTMLAYLAGPRAGATAYNAVHTYLPTLALVLAGFSSACPRHRPAV